MARIHNCISLGIITALVVLYCTCSINIAGGSSDHGNANVIGTVYDTLGAVVEGVSLRLLPENYNPAKPDHSLDSLTAITDSTGIFELYNVPSGTYCLIGEHSSGQLRLFEKPVAVDSGSINSVHAVLYRPGKIIIPVNYAIIPVNKRVIVYLPGTDVLKEFQSNIQTIYIDSVPTGRFTLKGYLPSNNMVVSFEREYSNFYVMSGGIVDFTIRPIKPRGPKTAPVNSECQFNTYFNEWNSYPHVVVEYLEYRFSWGDADTSAWAPGLYASHSWSRPGTYEVRVHMRCQGENTISDTVKNNTEKIPFYSGWSDSTIITIKSK